MKYKCINKSDPNKFNIVTWSDYDLVILPGGTYIEWYNKIWLPSAINYVKSDNFTDHWDLIPLSHYNTKLGKILYK